MRHQDRKAIMDALRSAGWERDPLRRRVMRKGRLIFDVFDFERDTGEGCMSVVTREDKHGNVWTEHFGCVGRHVGRGWLGRLVAAVAVLDERAQALPSLRPAGAP